MKGYTAKDVARMLDLSIAQVRSLALDGLLEPSRGRRGEYRFSFQDLVLLRTAKELRAARIPGRRLRSALSRLRDQLPKGQPLSAVQIQAQGERIVVREGDALWDPESGQAAFNFDVAELVEKAAPHARRVIAEARRSPDELDAEEWYELGIDLEASAPAQAREAYQQAIELRPRHVEARLNLGRLLHESGQVHLAEAHFRIALTYDGRNGTALFNLGVALEDQGRTEEARRTYLDAISVDPECADAYFNLARLYERSGEGQAALRHLKTYRELTDKQPRR